MAHGFLRPGGQIPHGVALKLHTQNLGRIENLAGQTSKGASVGQTDTEGSVPGAAHFPVGVKTLFLDA